MMFIQLPLLAHADDMPKENSFRYKNGVPVEIESETTEMYDGYEGEVRIASDGLKGIDVSTFQGDIDWEKVKADGIDFAIIRCGLGDDYTAYDDSKWKRNAEECTRLGIPFGAYLYSYAASTAEAESEAAHAIRLLQGYNLSYPVYLDLEDDVVASCSNEMIGQMADIFCTTLQNKGYEVGIYANLNWWNTKLTSDVFNNSTWHKWVAQWGASSCSYNGDYSMWQYTSTGSVNGINGNVDMDIWYGTAPDSDPIDYSYPNTYINTGDSRADIIGVAETQIGYTEMTSKDGVLIIDPETPYYTKYGESYGNPYGHWCAYFVLWCAKQAGLPTSVICQSAACGSCRNFINWFRSNHGWQDSSYDPQSGDIVFFDWEQDGSADHVGIVKDVGDGVIYTIEGNTGGVNGYAVMERDRYRYIYGYGVPDYGLMDKINGYASKDQDAYMLPDPNSNTIWDIWEKDELQVLCRDGDYYLVLYPFEHTGKFIAAYVPIDSVSLNVNVPYAEQYYNISVTGVVKKDSVVYHNPSDDDIIGSSNRNVKERSVLTDGDKVEVLFESDDYVFVRTENLTGYMQKSDITYQSKPDITGDINGDGITDAGDAGMILRFDAGLLYLTQAQITIGDINGDGILDAGDAGIILRKDAGLR